MRFSLVLFVVLLTSSSVVLGQGQTQQLGGRVTSQRSIGKSISDPKDQLSLAAFLANDSVANEIAFDATQLAEIRKMLADSRGSMSIGVIRGDQETIGKMTNEEVQTMFAAQRLEREAKFSSIIDPNQLRRLREIAFQIEIARVGIGEALTNGFLGKDIGVEVSQMNAIRTVAESAERRATDAILKFRTVLLDDLLTELTSSQSVLLKERLGNRFRFLEDPGSIRYEYRVLSPTGKLHAIPDPSSFVTSLGLTMNTSVADELKLTEVERNAIAQLHKEAKTPIAAPIFRRGKSAEELTKGVEEFIGHSKQERLSQIAFHIEVARLGIAEALMNGYLGQDLGLDKSQRESIARKSEVLKTKEAEAVKLIMTAQWAEVFSMLNPLQRDKAHSNLGNPFLFVENTNPNRYLGK
jgi:hypothetical protein